jgi:hypothetical protein
VLRDERLINWPVLGVKRVKHAGQQAISPTPLDLGPNSLVHLAGQCLIGGLKLRDKILVERDGDFPALPSLQKSTAVLVCLNRSIQCMGD